MSDISSKYPFEMPFGDGLSVRVVGHGQDNVILINDPAEQEVEIDTYDLPNLIYTLMKVYTRIEGHKLHEIFPY